MVVPVDVVPVEVVPVEVVAVVSAWAVSSSASLAKTSTAASVPMHRTTVTTMNQRSPLSPGNCGQRFGMTSAHNSEKTTNAAAISPRPIACPVERPSSTWGTYQGRKLRSERRNREGLAC